MKQETAKHVTDLILRQAREQDNMLQELQGRCDEQEFHVIRNMIAKTLASLYLDCAQPIFAEHPNLRPEGLL